MVYYDHTKKEMHEDAFDDEIIFHDEPVLGAQEAISNLSKQYNIIWVSARKHHLLDLTKRWLNKHGFPIDDIFLVEQNDNKIPVLIDIQPFVFVDDMKYNWENLDPKPCTNFIKALEINSISYEIFNNNWSELVLKYLVHK